MARNLMGCTTADVAVSASNGALQPGSGPWPVYTTGPYRDTSVAITDLTDMAGTPITQVTFGADGVLRYYSPDGDTRTHWLDVGQGLRIAVRPVEPPVVDGSITNASVAADAAIDASKIAGAPIVVNAQPADEVAVVAQRLQPHAAGSAPWTTVISDATFSGVVDPVMFIGYNSEVATGNGTAGEPTLYEGFEAKFRTTLPGGSVHNTMEWYVGYVPADHVGGFRPFQVTLGRDTGDLWGRVRIDIGREDANHSQFNFIGGTGGAAGTEKVLFSLTNDSAYWDVPMRMRYGSSLMMDGYAAGNADPGHVAFCVDGVMKARLVYITAWGTLNIWNDVNSRSTVEFISGATDDTSLVDFHSSVKVGGKVGFYGTTPVAKPTGVAVSAAGIHAALVTLGLIAA